MRVILKKPALLALGALALQVVGFLLYRWSWIASFGRVRLLPEAYDVGAPLVILVGIGVFGMVSALLATFALLTRSRWWVALPLTLAMIPCVCWSGLCLYASCLFLGWV